MIYFLLIIFDIIILNQKTYRYSLIELSYISYKLPALNQHHQNHMY